MKRKRYLIGLLVALYFAFFFTYLTWENEKYSPKGPIFEQANDYPIAFSGGN